MNTNKIVAIFGLTAIVCIAGCQEKTYRSNGESIFKSGRNINGDLMLDKKTSSVTLFKSCQGCHGATGDRMKRAVIAYKNLSDPEIYEVPYTDSLIIRFLDEDLKSDGQKANIGVRWNMSAQDKRDLIAYLKTLKK